MTAQGQTAAIHRSSVDRLLRLNIRLMHVATGSKSAKAVTSRCGLAGPLPTQSGHCSFKIHDREAGISGDDDGNMCLRRYLAC